MDVVKNVLQIFINVVLLFIHEPSFFAVVVAKINQYYILSINKE